MLKFLMFAGSDGLLARCIVNERFFAYLLLKFVARQAGSLLEDATGSAVKLSRVGFRLLLE